MKKYYLLFACLLASASLVFANENDVLQYDEQNIEAEFNRLNQLEKHVTTHQGVTLEDVSATNSSLIQDMVLESNAIAAIMAEELPGNIPPFWWGFCLGAVGLLVVYLVTDNDREQVKKAFTGCLISTGIWLALYLALGPALR